MATERVTEYKYYDFTPEELPVAQTFNFLQKYFLHNMRYEAVLQRDALVPDFQCPEDYFYKKAQLDGQIAVLTYLIDLNVVAEQKSTEG